VIVYAGVEYQATLRTFRVLALRDQNGTELTHLIDTRKLYDSTLQLGTDLSKKLGSKIRVEIKPD
jgi:hypothetical protein